MITRNFKHVFANTLTRLNTGAYSRLYGVDVNGYVYYFCSNYPDTVTISGSVNATTSGISVGRSNTPATEFDYNLGDTITSGISITTVQNEYGNKNNNMYIDYIVTVTNTSSEVITINEIGYKQGIKAFSRPGLYNTSSSNFYTFLIDRTVFDTPVIIQPGDAGTIHYKIETNYNSKTVNGIEIVDWSYGDDDKIAAMLAAAQQGIINLQRDTEWVVGQKRYINIGSFTAGNVTFNSQKIVLVISSFEEYENCGNVIQLDLLDVPASSIRMNSTTSNAYNTSEMYTSSLPALEAALPNWLRQLLRTFNVKVGAGNNSSEIITVGNNKLALRSAAEIAGTNISALIEGEQIQLYKQNKTYWYKYVNNGNTAVGYWLRTPYSTNKYQYISSSNTLSSYSATGTSNYVAPFMCI